MTTTTGSGSTRGRSVEALIKFIELNDLKIFYNEPIDDSPPPAGSESGQVVLPNGKNSDTPEEHSTEILRELCDGLVEIIERCIGPSDIDIKDEIYTKFLTSVLPKIVDIFLKRKTSRFVHVFDSLPQPFPLTENMLEIFEEF
jgi:hypothetical protein